MNYNDKQVQIMEAAEELFAENGFDGTSVRDIAEQSDVNLAMINYYFGTKEKLLEAIFKYRGDVITLQLRNMLQNKELSSWQKMESLIDDYISRIMSKPCFHKIMSRTQMSDTKSPTAKLIFNLKRTNQDLIKQLIQEGQKKGEFKKGIDVPMLMATLVGTASHIVTTQHYFRVINDLQDMSDTELENYLRKKLSSHLKNIFKAVLTNE